MKKHVITLAQTFSKDHPRAGEPTNFASLIERGVKKHTIRINGCYWHSRFAQIERGEACLSVREWTGKPYRSKQRTLWELTKDDDIGWAYFYIMDDGSDQVLVRSGAYSKLVPIEILAANDGLSVEDFRYWFEKYTKHEPHLDDFFQPYWALIYFNGFRYI